MRQSYGDEPTPSHTEPYEFDVIVESVIGHVKVDYYGDGDAPDVTAFKLIAQHGGEGRFKFPLSDSVVCHVTVEHEVLESN